jgi:hypothetical protein
MIMAYTKTGLENYDLGAGPVDIARIFKPGKPEIDSIPDLRISFIFILEYSESAINLAVMIMSSFLRIQSNKEKP